MFHGVSIGVAILIGIDLTHFRDKFRGALPREMGDVAETYGKKIKCCEKKTKKKRRNTARRVIGNGPVDISAARYVLMTR